MWEQNCAPPPEAQHRVDCNLIVGSTESAEMLYVLILYCKSMFVSIMEYLGKPLCPQVIHNHVWIYRCSVPDFSCFTRLDKGKKSPINRNFFKEKE